MAATAVNFRPQLVASSRGVFDEKTSLGGIAINGFVYCPSAGGRGAVDHQPIGLERVPGGVDFLRFGARLGRARQRQHPGGALVEPRADMQGFAKVECEPFRHA